MKRFLSLFIAVCMLSLCFFSCKNEEKEKEASYNDALNFIENGNYEAAYEKLKELGDYKDSEELIGFFKYVPLKSLHVDSGVYDEVFFGEDNIPTGYIHNYSDNSKNTWSFTYDDNNRLTKARVEYFDTYSSNYNYTYDANGKLIRKVENGDQYITEYTYDSNGNLIKEVYKTSQSENVREIDLMYNEDNLLVKEIESYTGSQSVTEYTYNESKKLTNKVFTQSGGLKTTYEYTYDSENNLTKKIKKYPNGNEEIFEYTYDAKSNLVKYNESSAYSTQVKEYFYNEAGQLIKIVRGDLFWEYLYDENGNMIKLSTNENAKRDKLSVWEISYEFMYIPYELPEVVEQVFIDWMDITILELEHGID